LERLNAMQKKISVEFNAKFVGETVEVLVEGASKTDATRRFGRTSQNTTVNFDGDAPIGALVKVQIQSASAASMSGKQVSVESLPTVMIPEVMAAPEVCVA
ncbi:MAG: TRAM domain-containing protein, partial [Archangium sp.]|nr:TRAM domain-containing protein [Archangium sp.]